jgi:hypothetical protein
MENELKDEELSQFIEHIETCAECYDELAIQFLAKEGLARLEEGASFSLDEELSGWIRSGQKRLKFHERVENVCRVFEGISILAMAVAVIIVIW